MQIFFWTRQYIKNFLTKGHERSLKAKKNILASLFIKGSSIVISLILVPLTINYISPSGYGVWLTLSSIVAWFGFFDVGLTQGLRNRLAEAISINDINTAQIYVSTIYAILGIVFSFFWLIILFINPLLNWSEILNVPIALQSDVSILAIIVFSYFCISFVIRIISTILIADQQPALSSLIDLVGQLISLFLVFILVKTTEGSLIKLGLALCLSPLLVLIFANIVLFNGRYKKIRPIISKVKFSYGKGLLNLGIIFFVIQVANIVQFQTANIIIARNFSTSDVTSFNIVYKYFGVLNMIFAIFLIPFWSASTEAFLKHDIEWIKNGIRKYNILNILIFVGGIFMLIVSDFVYDLWLGKSRVEISFSLSFWGFLFFCSSVFGGKYVSFLNGISALRIQFYASFISLFIYIVVTYILIQKFNLGVQALFISALIANFNTYFLAPLQYYQIINKNKKGIWIK